MYLDALQINETCPKCGHGEMEFHTLQLRSADEGTVLACFTLQDGRWLSCDTGTTVFYNCPKCSHSWSTNN